MDKKMNPRERLAYALAMLEKMHADSLDREEQMEIINLMGEAFCEESYGGKGKPDPPGREKLQ